MSLDNSLKAGNGLAQHRNVLTRTERVAKLKKAGDWEDGEHSPIGMRKVANRKIVTGKKSAKKKTEDGEA